MNRSSQSPTISGRRKLWLQILGLAALVALIWLEPRVETWFGVQNQEIKVPADSESEGHDSQSDDAERVSPVSQIPGDSLSPENAASASSETVEQSSPPTNSNDNRTVPEKNTRPRKNQPSAGKPEYGKLKEIRTNVFQSTGGLVYRSGSEDGHRLKHVMQHAKDNPQKKIHGVFDGDGDRTIVLAVIDEAYIKAKKGGSDVRSERQNDRQVFTVNLRRRIGQMGGEEGERKGHPECRYLRMVLENGNEVITAYPTGSF